MWTRIRKLLVGIVATLSLKELDSTTIRAALLAALERLADAAKVTPTLWDDLVIGATERMIRNDEVWAVMWEWLARLLPAAAAAPGKFNVLTDADLEGKLSEYCQAG